MREQQIGQASNVGKGSRRWFERCVCHRCLCRKLTSIRVMDRSKTFVVILPIVTKRGVIGLRSFSGSGYSRIIDSLKQPPEVSNDILETSWSKTDNDNTITLVRYSPVIWKRVEWIVLFTSNGNVDVGYYGGLFDGWLTGQLLNNNCAVSINKRNRWKRSALLERKIDRNRKMTRVNF